MSSDSFDHFSNGDFQQTVANIMAKASPRKPKSENMAIYEITDKQREYYTNCFLHLVKITQGTVSVADAAVRGSDSRVQHFFTKSGLDNEELSRIWELADMNEDGWLDQAEFTTAMHLVVIRVKGGVPIPNSLPLSLMPPLSVPRKNSQDDLSPSPPPPHSPQPPSTSKWSRFDECDGPVSAASAAAGGSSLSEDHLHRLVRDTDASPRVPEFSDVPPLLVDGRPTAVKIAALPASVLSLRSPAGPPPQPPPRPDKRGHGRSASLDLNTLKQGEAVASAGGAADPFRPISHSMHAGGGGEGAAPPVPAAAPSPAHSAFRQPMAPPSSAPPPKPVRTSPPSPQKKSVSCAGTQTEAEWVDAERVERFIAEFGWQLGDLLGEETAASAGVGVSGAERWMQRCEGLRRQNAELESERARLAQVRIQLELRLQEMDQLAKTSSKTDKPTEL